MERGNSKELIKRGTETVYGLIWIKEGFRGYYAASKVAFFVVCCNFVSA
jgi:hypothetical protein